MKDIFNLDGNLIHQPNGTSTLQLGRAKESDVVSIKMQPSVQNMQGWIRVVRKCVCAASADPDAALVWIMAATIL